MKQYDDYDRNPYQDRGYGEKYPRDREDRIPQKDDRLSDYAFSKPMNSLSDNARLYVTIRKGLDSLQEYKKLIMIVPVNMKISMLKRNIEREFADLFPREPTFICGKLEDQYGYALSNSSFVYEILRNGDRITAYPEELYSTGNNSGDKSSKYNDNQYGKQTSPNYQDQQEVPVHTTDITEILYMLKNIQQSICQKLADSDLKSYPHLIEALHHTVPLGFSPSKVIVHNASVCLLKCIANERLGIFDDHEGTVILNLIVTLLNYWIAELVPTDSYLLSMTIEILEILTKSANFCTNFKGGFVLSNLMNASNLNFISSQTKSRIIKIVTYLSKGDFKNYYNANQPSDIIIPKDGDSKYVPSFIDPKSPDARRRTPNKSQGGNTTTNNRKLNGFDAYGNPDDYRAGGNSKNTYDKDYSSNSGKDYITKDYLNNKRDDGPQFKSINSRADSSLYKDYLNLLSPGNAKEMSVYAVQNLDPMIDRIIDSIMNSKEEYLKLLNVVELELPLDYEPAQIRILNAIEKNLVEERASEGLAKGIVARILKAFSYQPSSTHQSLMNLLQTHVIKGKYRVDISTIISIILSPYSRLHDFAIKALSIMSDPNIHENVSYDIQFENHIKLLVELTTSKKKSYDFKNLALQTLANVALKENLKPQILYNRGLETLLYHLRNEENLDGQRLAAKALLNLSANSRDTKLKIITELGEEIKKMHRNELDPIVQGYIQTLVNTTR